MFFYEQGDYSIWRTRSFVLLKRMLVETLLGTKTLKRRPIALAVEMTEKQINQYNAQLEAQRAAEAHPRKKNFLCLYL